MSKKYKKNNVQLNKNINYKMSYMFLNSFSSKFLVSVFWVSSWQFLIFQVLNWDEKSFKHQVDSLLIIKS